MSRRVYADFDAELVLRLANRTDITSTMRGFFLNDAYQAIVNEFDHPEFEGSTTATVALSDSSYTPSVTDLWWPVFVKDTTNNRPIDKKALEDIESRVLVTGPLNEYYWWANVFYFDRSADAATAIKIWYKKKPAIWTSGSPAFAQMYDPMIVMRAAQLALSTVGNQEAAHIQSTEANNYVAGKKIAPDESEKNDRRTGFRVRYK